MFLTCALVVSILSVPHLLSLHAGIGRLQTVYQAVFASCLKGMQLQFFHLGLMWFHQSSSQCGFTGVCPGAVVVY